MEIHVYSICWNEADMLGFFFRNYDRVASRYMIYDDGSTDGSLQILRTHPKVQVRRFPRVIEDSYALSARELHNSVWKESRSAADWVIITAIDEHLHHADIKDYLERCKRRGITLVPALGFQMLSAQFPEPEETLSETRRYGAPFDKMNKLCVFNPTALEETNYHPGRHRADPAGEIVLPERDELLNLHYKYLDIGRVFERHKLLASGLGNEDRKRGYGHRYWFTMDQLKEDWRHFESEAVDIRTLRADPARVHLQARWWRDESKGYETRSV